jgi:hypothetical protein
MVTSGLTGATAATIMSAASTLQLASLQNSLGAELPANAAKIFDTLDNFMRGNAFSSSTDQATATFTNR